MERLPDTEKFMSVCRSVNVLNPLENIHNYNDKMTISQVVRFFERQGIYFTKTMIQNYVRQSVIPPPYEKRYYTKIHLLLLVLIDSVKEIYSLEEIRDILRPSAFISDDIGETSAEALYERLLLIYQTTVVEWVESVPAVTEKAAAHISELGMEDDPTSQSRMAIFQLMAQSAAIKKSVRMLMEKIDL